MIRSKFMDIITLTRQEQKTFLLSTKTSRYHPIPHPKQIGSPKIPCHGVNDPGSVTADVTGVQKRG